MCVCGLDSGEGVRFNLQIGQFVAGSGQLSTGNMYNNKVVDRSIDRSGRLAKLVVEEDEQWSRCSGKLGKIYLGFGWLA